MASDPVWEGNMGRNWARLREATDRQLAEVGEVGLDRLKAKPGERILDLGCGGGTTTLAISGAVGPTGRVSGIDVSPDLVAHACQRLEAFPQATMIEAEAASHPFEPASHDALFSRHGCMFFTDALAAFTNIRSALRPDARAVMTAFTSLAENPWATVPLQAAESVLGRAPEAFQPPPGPFAWAEPSVFEKVLRGAGFRSVAWERRSVTFTVGAGDDPDPIERACNMVLSIGMVARRVMTEGEGARDRVRPALRQALGPHVRDRWVRLPAQIWLVTAIA